MGVDRQTKHKITAVTAKRYRTVDRKGKTTILDEFTAITGYNRKYTLYILAHWDSTRTTVLDGKTVRPKAAKPKHKRKPGGGRPKVYFDEMISVLAEIGSLQGIPANNTAEQLRN